MLKEGTIQLAIYMKPEIDFYSEGQMHTDGKGAVVARRVRFDDGSFLVGSEPAINQYGSIVNRQYFIGRKEQGIVHKGKTGIEWCVDQPVFISSQTPIQPKIHLVDSANVPDNVVSISQRSVRWEADYSVAVALDD